MVKPKVRALREQRAALRKELEEERGEVFAPLAASVCDKFLRPCSPGEASKRRATLNGALVTERKGRDVWISLPH